MKKLTALVVMAAFLALQVPPAAFADDSDIFGANIQPNILILLDSSGSMDDEIPSQIYVAATTYSTVNLCGRRRDQTCVSAKVYHTTGTNQYREYADTVADVSSSSARNALNSRGYWSGRISGSNENLFTGNYLNFQLGVCASGACTGERKIDIAKRVLKDLVDSVTGVRFGLMRFDNNGSQGNGGGRLAGTSPNLAHIGSSASLIKTAIGLTSAESPPNGTGIQPSGYTPLGEFLNDAGRYYKGDALRNGSDYSSPIQLSCQSNFVILISDGLQNGSVDVRTEGTLRRTQDHASWLSDTPNIQNVIVHTVGFGIGASEPGDVLAANDVLRTAATNGGGQFYSTENSTQLEEALQDAIRRIISATFTFATPVVPTTTTTGSSRAYLAAFKSDPSRPFWEGFLKAYQRDANGLIPVDANNVPLDSAKVWDAGAVLGTTTSSSRTIKTVTSVTLTPTGTSTVGTGSLASFDKGNGAITTTMLDVTTSTERDRVIDFVRGVDVNDWDTDGDTTEDRSKKLGDVFHSTPVLVTPPIRGLADTSYQAFKAAKAGRTTILLAGSNDGMLHAYRESDGAELWAFVPPDLLSTLKNVTTTSGEHPFFVDASPIAADIKVSGSWKTIVVFGLRRGGNHYYALDITDTTNPLFMWSFTDTKMGETWSEPAIGKVKIGTTDTYAMFVGGGYDTGHNNNSGKAFFAIDLSNGSKLWEYYNSSSSDDRQYMNFSIAANPTAVDLDNNGYIDKVYVGDVGGHVWKFNVAPTDTASWQGRRLFNASPGQANPPANGEYYPAQGIYGAPSLAFDTANNLWLFVGTGDRNHPNSTASNHFYGLKESDSSAMTNNTAITESSLVNVTSTSDLNATSGDGWRFDLASTEKVLAAANIFNGDVLFTTFTPTSTVTCESGGGTAKLYAMSMTSGYATLNFSTGASITTTDHTVARSTTIGTGIASMPVIVLTPPPSGSGSASANAITLTTDQQTPATLLPTPGFLKQVRAWRERVR